jgi:hypothetical protein
LARPVRRRITVLWLAAACVAVLAGCGPSAGGGSAGTPSASASPPAKVIAWAADLKLENQALTAALLAQMKHDVQREERARMAFGRPDAFTNVDAILWEEPGLRSVVRDYFDRLLRGGLPGEQGVAARRNLQDFFPPGSPALARARWLAKGRLPRDPDKVLPEDFSFSALAMIHDLRLSADRRHAVVVVDPIRGFWLYSEDGRLVKGSWSQFDEGWEYLESDAPHRLVLVRRSDGWKIVDDFTLGDYANDVASRLRHGGAPRAVYRGEAARVRRAVQRPVPIPAGAVAAFQRFIDLLNAHEYRATDAVFEGGNGYRAFMFSDPWGDGRYELRKVTGFARLSRAAVSSAPDVPVVLDIAGDGAGYNYAGGGMLGYSTWHAHRTESGEWLIAGDGTDMPWALAGSWP